MFDLATIVIVFLTFVLAGWVKGVIGMGLPSVSLAILTLAIDLPTAMALLLAPSLITNFWQAIRGGHLHQLCFKFWPFFFPAILTIWFGVQLGTQVDVQLLSTLLGLLLIGYAVFGLYPSRIKSPQDPSRSTIASHPTSVIMGGINGLLSGLTGSFVVPGVMYLQARGLHRDQLIQAMGILFTVSTLGLGIALAGEQRISAQMAWLSLAAIVPAILGMVLGQQWRPALSEKRFRRLFFLALLLIGAYITVSSLSFS